MPIQHLHFVIYMDLYQIFFQKKKPKNLVHMLHEWDISVIQNLPRRTVIHLAQMQTLDPDFHQCCFTSKLSHTYLTCFLCCWLNPLMSCLYPPPQCFLQPLHRLHQTYRSHSEDTLKNRTSVLSSERSSPLHTNSNILNFPLIFSTSTHSVFSTSKLFWLN